MAGIRTLPKLTGTGIDPQISQWAAQIVDTLNPALRELATATDFRWLEVDGAIGAAPTFALQLAQGFGWTTIAQFDVSGRLLQPAWIPPSFLNGWLNFGSGLMAAGFFKDSLGTVRLRGVIKSGTINTAAFVLPAGYRPSAIRQFPSIDGLNAAGLVQIDTAGNVIPQIGSNATYRLDGISFDPRA